MTRVRDAGCMLLPLWRPHAPVGITPSRTTGGIRVRVHSIQCVLENGLITQNDRACKILIEAGSQHNATHTPAVSHKTEKHCVTEKLKAKIMRVSFSRVNVFASEALGPVFNRSP